MFPFADSLPGFIFKLKNLKFLLHSRSSLLHLRTVQEKLVVPLGSETEKQSRNELEVYAIQAENLVRRFGEVEALSHVSVSIRKGEFFSLLGPSGCGKTTLLRLIAGLDLPDGGTLRIAGKDATQIPAYKRPVNTVFQSYALFPHLSIRDNVAFGLRMKKIPSREITERVDRIMTLVEISAFADRRPGQLSGGQKQRVALARALVNEPEVLLLEETVAGGTVTTPTSPGHYFYFCYSRSGGGPGYE
jgi:ABC-type lipoprotein export system ATPase subunit